MTLRGHVDGLRGRNVVGWADGGLGTCQISVQSTDGVVLSTGFASRDRPDLSPLGLGRTTLGFMIELPSIPDCGMIHVFADGLELPRSPIRVGQGYFDGQFGVSDGIADGWVTERFDGADPPLVEIINQDGRCVGSGYAAKQSADDPFQCTKFRIELDDTCFGCGEVELAAQANGVTFAKRTYDLPLHGHLDKVTPEQVTGWLFAPSAPNRVFFVQAYRDGILAGSSCCNMPRRDVQSVYPESKAPGFVLTLDPPAIPDLALHEYSFRLAGSEADLFDSPYVIGPMADWITTARKVARLSLNAELGLGTAERFVLRGAIANFIADSRAGQHLTGSAGKPVPPMPATYG